MDVLSKVGRLPLSTRCAACTASTGDGFRLCKACGGWLSSHLGDVPQLLSELDITYARRDVLGVSDGRGGASGLPYKPLAGQARGRLIELMLHWGAQLASSPWDVPHDPAELAGWLIGNVGALRQLEHAGSAYSQLRGAIERAWVAIDRPPCRTRFPVADCIIGQGVHACTGTIWALIPTRETDPALLRCNRVECIGVWTTPQWRRLGKVVLARRTMAEQS